ncbi:MAG: toll/interleukin-1 receptor domain-containing protein [Pseudonocardiaceae bacterium]
MIRTSKSYDFFISYAGPDIAYAQKLSDTLQPVGRTFLAPQSFLPGEDWPAHLPIMIKDTWVTLVIISQHTPAAHFQMEEILLAIQEVRAGFHTVVPIRLSAGGKTPPLPVGLNSKNCLDLHSGSQTEINSVIDKLRAARDDIRSRGGLGWRTSREYAGGDPLRDALERVKTYEQNGLLRTHIAEEIQLILLKHHLINDQRDT